MSEPRQYFDFLKLPRELRDEIYEYALCSFTQHCGRYDIEDCAAVSSRAMFERRRFTGNLNLLLANKQIHGEGYECMLTNNLFVLIQCPHYMLETLIYGHIPHIPILDYRTHTGSEQDSMNDYPWYVMRLKIEEKFGYSGSAMPSRQYPDIVMLLEDCMELFKRFGVHLHEDFLPDPKGKSNSNCRPLKVEVELNSRKQGGDRKTSFMDLRSSYPAIDQRKLLELVKGGFRDCDYFEIKNCDDSALAAEIIEAVSKGLSMSLDTFRSHLESHARHAEASFKSGDITECANLCAAGIELVQRVRSNGSLMPKLRDEGLRDCVDVSKANYELHHLLAQCIFAYLPTLMDGSAEAGKEGRISNIAQYLRGLFQWYDSRAYGFLPRYRLSGDDQAAACYMRAKVHRLGLEYCGSSFDPEFIEHIQKALRLEPENVDYKQEQEKAIIWHQDNARYLDWLRETDCREFRTMPRWREEIDHSKYLL
ncbi:uncharacterized protein yc1106_02448 [Curvularia clavata]|uniref:Uncharacterized protein n=1 Tax=Curvularia clavata TaxID=95742 RepID=A0A9Q9DQY2_CURCL|nr:uncharacterized protein yc1106_02448 [Curvularia clavata]